MTSLPAANLRLRDRGRLEPGCYADVVVFDPNTVADYATFAEPHQLSTGVRDVFVNGEAVLRDGAHTGAKPGRVVHEEHARQIQNQLNMIPDAFPPHRASASRTP